LRLYYRKSRETAKGLSSLKWEIFLWKTRPREEFGILKNEYFKTEGLLIAAGCKTLTQVSRTDPGECNRRAKAESQESSLWKVNQV
jgi:hypothetical protein